MNIEKIRKILDDKYESVRGELWDKMKKPIAGPGGVGIRFTKFAHKMDEFWTEYMNSLDCTLITEEDIKEDLEGIINDSSRGRVCIRFGMRPAAAAMDRHYILMPQDLADKVLVLGGLPDFDEAGVVERQTR